MTTWTSQPLANAARRSGVNCVYAIKYATELVGKFDRKALADNISAAEARKTMRVK